MNMNAKVILFGLMGLAACQSQTEKKSDQAVADTLQNELITKTFSAPAGRAYCEFADEELDARTSAKRITGDMSVAVIGVDSNGICHICTSLRDNISELAFYPDKPEPSLPLVRRKTIKPVEGYIDAVNGLEVIQIGVNQNCEVPEQYRSRTYPIHGPGGSF